jgi:hypothetical protein
MVWRNKEHQPIIVCSSLREAAKSNYTVLAIPSTISHSKKHTKVACLYAFSAKCNISPASSLVSFTNPVPITNSLGNVASTILSKSALLSPDLNLNTRQIARRHCKPAKIDAASFVFSSLSVTSMNPGHLAGKSQCRIFCSTGTSWARTAAGEVESTGSKRSRKRAFSSSGMALRVAGASSLTAQARETRFLR